MSEDKDIDGIEVITTIQELEVIGNQLHFINELIKMPETEEASPYSQWPEHRIKMIESCYKVIIEANKSIVGWLKDESK